MDTTQWREEINKWDKKTLEKFVRAVNDLMDIPVIKEEFYCTGLTTLKYLAESRLKHDTRAI